MNNLSEIKIYSPNTKPTPVEIKTEFIRLFTFREAINYLDAAPNELRLTFDPRAGNKDYCVLWTKIIDLSEYIPLPNRSQLKTCNDLNLMELSLPADLSEIKKIIIEATANNGRYPLGHSIINIKSPKARRTIAHQATYHTRYYLKRYEDLDSEYRAEVYFKSEDWCPICAEFFEEPEGRLTAQGVESCCPACGTSL